MLRISEQSREAGTRVEAGEATPVDRSRPTDERRRLQIPDERVVLDPPPAADIHSGDDTARDIGATRQ